MPHHPTKAPRRRVALRCKNLIRSEMNTLLAIAEKMGITVSTGRNTKIIIRPEILDYHHEEAT